MEETRSVRASAAFPTAGSRPSPWRQALKVTLILLFILGGAAGGFGIYVLGKFSNTSFKDTLVHLPGTISAWKDPRQEFPGQDRINVLCLGLDRNIFKIKTRDPELKKLNGQPYTKGARSDVMMVASLDLQNQTVNILSIPRDTRVQLPGKRSYSKINQAHADGGIPYTIETVEQFLGIHIDHYVVIKQEAIEKVVDELGGLQVKVDKDMDYDDNWGNLHVHLKEGAHRLSGLDVAGYMRFRHDAEGDFGRIRRQQQVIQLLSGEAKNPAILFKAPGVIDAIRSFVQTDLSPNQQLALTNLFHRIEPSNVVTAQLPVADMETIDNVSYVIPDDAKKEFVVDWIVNRNPDAMNRMIRVELKNASGDPELYQRIYKILRHSGFEVWRAGRASGEPLAASRIVQRTSLKGSARRVLEVLGLPGNVEKLEASGPDVTLYVGKDLESNPILAFADNYDDLPDASPNPVRRRPAARRIRRQAPEPDVDINVRTVEEPQQQEPQDEPKAEDQHPAEEPKEPSEPDSGGGAAPDPREPSAPTSPGA